MSGPSEIEIALYGDLAHHVSSEGSVGEHCVVGISLRCTEFSNLDIVWADNMLELTVCPDGGHEDQCVVATFPNALLTGMDGEQRVDETDLVLPWRILNFYSGRSFGSQDFEGVRWGFHLKCLNCRLSWTSEWPAIVGKNKRGQDSSSGNEF
ncbi:MAG: hypothetical protein R3C10_11665 [Pirellulales bacterium]